MQTVACGISWARYNLGSFTFSLALLMYRLIQMLGLPQVALVNGFRGHDLRMHNRTNTEFLYKPRKIAELLNFEFHVIGSPIGRIKVISAWILEFSCLCSPWLVDESNKLQCHFKRKAVASDSDTNAEKSLAPNRSKRLRQPDQTKINTV